MRPAPTHDRPAGRRPSPGLRCPRRGPSIRRRPGFRPELEPVEARCLLSGYNLPVDLGTLFPRAINNLGQVVGGSPNSGAFLRQSNGAVVTVDPTGMADDLTDPSNPAQVEVVGTTGNGPDGGRVFLWDPSRGETITSIPASFQFGSTSAHITISNRVIVVVGNSLTSENTTHAFIWRDLNGNHNYGDETTDPGEFQDLHGLLATDSSGESVATDVIGPTSSVPHLQILADATIPGGCGWCSASVLTDSNDNLVVDASEKAILATYGAATMAFAIDDIGKVAGYSVPTGGSGYKDGHAVIWQIPASVSPVPITKDLGLFNRGTAGPSAINHAGWVAGTGAGAKSLDSRAWVWTGSGSIKDLNGQIPKNSKWFKLESAAGMNNAGTIVGQGQLTSGVEHGFLVTSTSVPALAMTSLASGLHDATASGMPGAEDMTRSASPILGALTPVADQDLTPYAAELIRAGKKRPGSSSTSYSRGL